MILSQLGPLQEKGKYCLLMDVTLTDLGARQNQQVITNSPRPVTDLRTS